MCPLAPRPSLPEGPFLVVGLARSGRAVAELLARRGELVIGVDRGSPEGAAGLRQGGVEVHLDAEGGELLDRVGAVIKSPGVPAQAAVVAAAHERGLPVLGELEIAWRLLPNRLLAVTGTNGKTTVTEWLGHLFAAAGEPVAVAGNVGTPLAALAGRLEPAATVVCECSSFQLEDSEEFAPDVAALLNFSPDHLDRHGTLEAYLEAKLRIFANQEPGDAAVTDADEPATAGPLPGRGERVRYGISACEDECRVRLRGGAIELDGEQLIAVDRLALAGEHNLRNAMAVAASAAAAGLDRDAIRRGLASFAGVPHRLERVGERGGVAFVNDSKATNAAAAAAALEAFPDGVHVILGGSLKGGGFEGLAPAVAATARGAYLIGEAAEAIEAALAGTGVPLRRCEGLAEAVRAAAEAAEGGEVVLLAPACASFDAFRDFEHRGEEFRRIVGGLE
jgi:UDP-N-acetylmuramoylalanine--D-glutamate ligase